MRVVIENARRDTNLLGPVSHDQRRFSPAALNGSLRTALDWN